MLVVASWVNVNAYLEEGLRARRVGGALLARARAILRPALDITLIDSELDTATVASALRTDMLIRVDLSVKKGCAALAVEEGVASHDGQD